MAEPDAAGHEVRRTWLALAFILVLAALVRMLSFRGYTTYDAAEYTRLAHMMISGQYKAGMLWFFHVFPVRVGIIAPTALAFRVGGVSEVTLTLYPFLLSLLGVALAFFAARAMFGARAGLVAALLMAPRRRKVHVFQPTAWLTPHDALGLGLGLLTARASGVRVGA
jgi:4-amino-4-deoxy-L-arabinose transferase-like glycosyltransferase